MANIAIQSAHTRVDIAIQSAHTRVDTAIQSAHTSTHHIWCAITKLDLHYECK